MIPSIPKSRPQSLNVRTLALLPKRQTSITAPRHRTLTTETNPKNNLPKRLPAEPLRILFCGSDTFSSQTLSYLNDLRLQTDQRRVGTPVGIWNGTGLSTVKVEDNDQVFWEKEGSRGLVDVDGIEVVVKSVKAVGRGRREVNETPVEKMAKGMGLKVHHIDSFTGWTPPRNINLIIAVSFGLFVPPRIIQSAKFGGLNIHPSLLPDLRGPAPIHHAILKGYTHTGVTVQTLHPSKFDHGTILAQTRRATLYELKPERSIQEHYHQLGKWGQRTLQSVLEQGTYRLEHVVGARREGEAESAQDVVDKKGEKKGWYAEVVEAEGGVVNHAPKLTGRDSQVMWFGGKGAGEEKWLASHFERAARAFPNIWTVLRTWRSKEPQNVRVVLHDVKVIDAARMEELEREQREAQSGEGENAAVESMHEGVHRGAKLCVSATDPVVKRSRPLVVRVVGTRVYFPIEEGEKWVEVPEMTVSGKSRRDAAGALGKEFVTIAKGSQA